MSAGDDLNLSMFRAYDIRTPASRLSHDLAARLARAEARYIREVLQTDGVVLAHDARRTGPAYLDVVSRVLCDAGLDVVVLPGVSSTSLFYYAAMCHPEYAGVMVGASHNPAGDTGQKIVGPGVEPIADGIGPQGGLDRLKELYVEDRPPGGQRPGRIRAVELIEEYIAYSMDCAGVAAGSLHGVAVLQDYLFGAAGREMMLAFERAGAALTPLHFTADGSFPLGDPNPVKPQVIGPGLDTLRSGGHLLGMFFDGDGDRLDVYGGDGSYLSSSFVYAGILPEIRRRHPAQEVGVFADLKSNPLAVIEMARAGVTVDVIRNGHSQIKESLRRDPSRVGAVEESAHFYEAFTMPGGGRFCTENTLYLALLLAATWSREPARFDRLFELQATTVREREWGYIFESNAARADALAAVKSHCESDGFASLERMSNGMELEATLMRRGLPFDVNQHTRLPDEWLQVCQRVSQSEDNLARWEVVGSSARLVQEAKRGIAAVVAGFGAGDEYRG